MSSNECPFCGETGVYENRAFKMAGKRRCKNSKCRVMFFKDEAEKAVEIDEGLQKFRKAADDLDDEKLEEIRQHLAE